MQSKLLANVPKGIADLGMTPFAKAMPSKYKISDDACECYRAYYLGEKKHLFNWKKREVPSWIM